MEYLYLIFNIIVRVNEFHAEPITHWPEYIFFVFKKLTMLMKSISFENADWQYNFILSN